MNDMVHLNSVFVCVRKRERGGKRGREREREREGGRGREGERGRERDREEHVFGL